MARKPAAKTISVAQHVRTYIDRRPVVRDALGMGIVNLSALTRRILDETELDQEEAVLVACRRYHGKGRSAGYERNIRNVLEKGKLEVRTRVAVWTLRPNWKLSARLEKALPQMQGSPVHILHGSESITVIADEQMHDVLAETFADEDILKHRTGLVEINLRTSATVENVPGILAFLTSSLAGRDINFVEVISCHKDNMFVIAEEDMFAAFEVLNDLLRR